MNELSDFELSDFDRYCDEHAVKPEDYPTAFAEWLAEVSGRPVIGGPSGEPPEFIALPPEEDDDPSL